MITIANYRNLMEAELAKTRLASYNIEAMIADEFSYTLGYGAIMDGVRLQVLNADAERAKKILASAEYVELPDDGALIAEAPETDASDSETFQEPATYTPTGRTGGWSVLPLFLCGILCLIMGRPTGDWSTLPAVSGQLILVGELLILAGLWISYGRLSAGAEHEIPPE